MTKTPQSVYWQTCQFQQSDTLSACTDMASNDKDQAQNGRG